MQKFIIGLVFAAIFVGSPALAQTANDPNAVAPSDGTTAAPTTPTTPPSSDLTARGTTPGTTPGTTLGTTPAPAASGSSESTGLTNPSPIEFNRLDPGAESGLRLQIGSGASGSVSNPDNFTATEINIAPGVAYNTATTPTSTNGLTNGSATTNLPSQVPVTVSNYPILAPRCTRRAHAVGRRRWHRLDRPSDSNGNRHRDSRHQCHGESA